MKRYGAISHANKTACRRRPHRDRCFKDRRDFKEVDLAKDQLEKPCRPWYEAAGTKPDRSVVSKGRFHYEASRVVVLMLVPDLYNTALRMGISEHPFGTIKRTMGCNHFLLRGLPKVEGEFSLMCLGYNMTRDESAGVRGAAGVDGRGCHFPLAITTSYRSPEQGLSAARLARYFFPRQVLEYSF